jgi:hypothetical protein
MDDLYQGKEKLLGGIPLKDVAFAFVKDGLLYVTDGKRAHCRLPLPDHLKDQPENWAIRRAGSMTAKLRRVDGEDLYMSLDRVAKWDTEATGTALPIALPPKWKQKIHEESGVALADIIPVLKDGAVYWQSEYTLPEYNDVFAGIVVPDVIATSYLSVSYWNDAVTVAGAYAPVRMTPWIGTHAQPLLIGSGPDAPYAILMPRKVA